MEFVALTHSILKMLKSKGYTVLHSISPITSEDPTWYPKKMAIERLMQIDNEYLANHSQPLNEIHFLIIQDALDNIPEEYLIGMVFIGDLK
ncbi:hypothetical protein B0I21_103244 [Sphingobacterium paludis]|uniref:Uncharacterized protein n=2 Tax=Sphingobacterium paludis TaxID=1476465 RepID=A0A4R7D4W3_9SPHI|nr:hypothetical protein B0I21_103244 [Sphingobacterium paludis]